MANDTVSNKGVGIDKSARPSFAEHLKELYNYRYLLRNLVVRDIKVRYKSSALGVLWSLLNPIFLTLVFWLVFTFQGEGTRDYIIFILVGLLPWNFFSSSVVGGANSILSNDTLIKKVYFPRELLPTAVVLSNLVNFLISLLVLLAGLYLTGLGLTIHALWVPVILFAQIIFTLGLVYFLSAAHVFLRDIAMILDVGMLALFFLTPIFYSLNRFGMRTLPYLGWEVDTAQVFRWLNPMASIIDAYRTVLWGIDKDIPASSMDLYFVGRMFVICTITFVVGYSFFRKTQYWFGEKI